jgi:hypothetical protein
MNGDLAPELLGWVRDGERLFGLVLQTLQRCEALEHDNRRLQEELGSLREELATFKVERLEAAEALKTFAEHVTRLATVTIDRLAARRP